MGKTRHSGKRKSNQADLTPEHLKKPKTSDSPLTEAASFSSAQDSGSVNLLANDENQKPELTLPLDSAKRRRTKKKKKKKPSGLEQNRETVSPLESVMKNKKTTNRGFKIKTTRQIFKEQLKGIFYVKDRCFDELLEKLYRSIDAMKQPKPKAYKIWMKQHFSVGVNEVTRTLERMPVVSDKTLESYISDFKYPQDSFSTFEEGHEEGGRATETPGQMVLLQAVLIAVDCHPRTLVSHFPGLASSRGVPLFSIEDHGSGSEQLGKLLNVKTAVAIGIKVAETRFTSNTIVLRRLVAVREALSSMVISQQWIWRQSSSERATNIRTRILDETWWSRAKYLLSFTEPILSMIRFTDMDKPCLGEVYDGIDSMIENMRSVINAREQDPEETFCKEVQSICVERWNKMTTPLHLLAFSLSPKYYSEEILALPTRVPPYRDAEVGEGFRKAIAKLFPNIEMEDVVTSEFADFVSSIGQSLAAVCDKYRKDVHAWWYLNGHKLPNLQILAIKVLSQVGESTINKVIQDAIDDQVSGLNSIAAFEAQEMATST